MTRPMIEVPFVWPDSRKLAGCPGPAPDINSLLAESQLVLGVVHDLTDTGVARLAQALTPKMDASRNDNGHPPAALPDKRIRLIVTLYPTCPTRAGTLMRLLHLQNTYSSLEIRLDTCGLLAGPQNTLAFYQSADTFPTLLFGSAASLETPTPEPNHLTLGFSPEPLLAAEWAKWFDVRWLKALRLTERRATIPHLVLPEGTLEAAQKWEAYERLFVEPKPAAENVEVTVGIVPSAVVFQSSESASAARCSVEVEVGIIPALVAEHCAVSSQGVL
jgi:hypothetical protein